MIVLHCTCSNEFGPVLFSFSDYFKCNVLNVGKKKLDKHLEMKKLELITAR